MIDRHNRYRQDDLQLEKKLQTKEGSMRVGMSISGIIVVDSWLVYKEATGTSETAADFFSGLAEELTTSNYNSHLNAKRRCRLELASSVTACGGSITLSASPATHMSSLTVGDERVHSGGGIHITPTKKMKKTIQNIASKATALFVSSTRLLVVVLNAKMLIHMAKIHGYASLSPVESVSPSILRGPQS
jgi:hypothetical protein